MTNQPPKSDPRELQGVLSRVNHLGTATERLFSRLYTTFNRRSQRQDEQMHTLQRKNRRLVAMVRQREAESQRLHGIISSMNEGIIMQDTEGRVVLVNNAARELLGSQRNLWESELGTLFETYRDLDNLDTELAPLGEPTRVQINNRILGAQVAAVSSDNGQRLGTMIVLRDVTQDTLAERLKDQFITAISHELRTPMTAIKGMSEVLLGQPADQPINRRFLETIGRNVDILDRMIVELLDLSEMGAEAFTVRHDALNVHDLLWHVVKGQQPEIRRSNIDVSLMVRDADRLQLTGDEQRIRWALGHLLQNSLHYTPPGGSIVITAMREEEHITIRVVDTGVGISEKDLPHIFERFYRGEPRDSNGRLLDPRGLGQGLFIARQVAEAHGGYLSVRSSQGAGSIFTLVLPVNPT